MERKLLLLGMLRGHNLYGYQINELIETHLGSSVALTKSTAYRFLNQMTENGWIEYQEEKSGNRPVRRVYTLLPAGEAAFIEMLRNSLRDFSPVTSQGTIGVAFLGALPSDEAIELLAVRRLSIEENLDNLVLDKDHHGGFEYVILHQIEHLKAELVWLDNVIQQIKNPPSIPSHI